MNVVCLEEYATKKKQVHIANDSEVIFWNIAIEEKRAKEIAKELTKGYMKLLSNFN